MKKILLFTEKNHIFRNEFSDAGYIVQEIEHPASVHTISRYANSSFKGYFVIEITNEDTDRLNTYQKLLNRMSANIVILTSKPTDNIKSFLIMHGIADLIVYKDIKRLINYVDIIDKDNRSYYGKILILDDHKPRINIIRSIVTRFGYLPIFTKTIDDLLNYAKETNIQLALINLGTEDFDINEFIKKSYKSSEIKMFPVIPYKDTNDGLFIHELLSGLNRIAKFVLSSDELYSYLIDILFKKEFFPLLGMLNESAMYENMARFSQESLNSLCYSLTDEKISMNNLLQKDRLNKFIDITNSIKNTIIKMDGISCLQ